MSPDSREDLEEIREELRRRGYLDSPLDRFLLRDRLRRHLSSAGAVAAVSLRVGFLGGPLVGVPLALATRLGGAAGGLLETTLLAVILSVSFGLVLALLEAASALVMMRLEPGAPGRAAARMAVVLGGLGSIYLAVWWQARRDPWLAAGWLDGLSVLLILLIALGLTRIASAAGSTVVAAQAAARHATIPQRPRMRLLPAALLFTLLLAAVLWWNGGSRDQVPVLTRHPVAGRLLVVGVDGIGPDLVTAPGGTEMMPSLGHLLQRSARRAIHRAPDGEPPSRWTTYATGHSPREHGVTGVEWQSLAGLPAPVDSGALIASLVRAADALLPASPLVRSRAVSGAIRRRPTVWEIIASQDLPVLVSRWWATSPAADIPGFVLSEQAFGRLAAGENAAGEIHPSPYATAMQQDFSRWLGEAGASLPAEAGEETLLRRALLSDRFHADAYLRRLQPGVDGRAPDPVAAFLYLSAPDIVAAAPAAGASQVIGSFVETRAALQATDRILARLMAVARPEDRLVILLDPGRHPGAGMVAVSGPGVATGEGRMLAPTEIAPTLLWLAGFPVSSEMDGSADVTILKPQARPPLRSVPRIGPPPLSRIPERDDSDARDYLRSLGYID